jgi:hypothetical protein
MKKATPFLTSPSFRIPSPALAGVQNKILLTLSPTLQRGYFPMIEDYRKKSRIPIQ